MDRESITLKMDGKEMLRLRELAAQVRMSTRSYCAMVLANHIMRKADIDAKGAQQ